jgi:hypothetical protein
MGEEDMSNEKPKASIMAPVHDHDCTKCVFIGNSHSSRGKTTDWYVCGTGKQASLIGRHSGKGPDYWSMDLSTLFANIDKPAHIVASNTYAYSEEMLIAYAVYNLFRDALLKDVK